uniref:Peroxin-13 n=1 Tax=Compsopogon caeruleus TaxID=31354 RepID=A0A7S1XHJ0_9RHOD
MGGLQGGMGGIHGNRWMGAVMAPGGEMVNTMHGVMYAIARVSGLMEEVLRNFHMIFESVYGLLHSFGVFQQEIVAVMGPEKVQPAGFFRRVLKKVLSFWRVFVLFIMSPLAGRFSPVSVALRILGLAPQQPPAVEVVELNEEEFPEQELEGELQGNDPTRSPDETTEERDNSHL